MSAVELLTVIVLMAALAGIVVVANYADRGRKASLGFGLRAAILIGNLTLVLNGVLTVATAASGSGIGDEDVTMGAAWGGLVASIIVAGGATALLFRRVRVAMAAVLQGRKRDGIGENGLSDRPETPGSATPAAQREGEPLFPQMLNYYVAGEAQQPMSGGPGWDAPVSRRASTETRLRTGGFNPDSYVHLVAVVLVLYMLGSQAISFILGGGLEGLAQSFETDGLSAIDLLVNSLPFVILSFLGVGLGIRRDWAGTLARLGLGPVTRQGVWVSLKLTFVLLVGLVILGMVWVMLVPEELYEEQTQASEALSRSVTSIGLAVLLAATAAVGEEIAFRGALQPVLGLWPTAVVFALTHTQYALTPAWLIIFGVAIAFGWVRQRYNTTVAILTHFWYNLIQLLFLFVMPESATESFLHILR